MAAKITPQGELEMDAENAAIGRMGFGIVLPLFDWLSIHGHIMLALRHPMIARDDPEHHQQVREFCDALEKCFVETGFLPEEVVKQVREGHASSERRTFGQGKPS